MAKKPKKLGRQGQVRCRHCSGTGKVEKRIADRRTGNADIRLVPCPKCKGSGYWQGDRGSL